MAWRPPHQHVYAEWDLLADVAATGQMHRKRFHLLWHIALLRYAESGCSQGLLIMVIIDGNCIWQLCMVEQAGMWDPRRAQMEQRGGRK